MWAWMDVCKTLFVGLSYAIQKQVYEYWNNSANDNVGVVSQYLASFIFFPLTDIFPQKLLYTKKVIDLARWI